RKNGEQFPVHLTSLAVKNVKGQPIGIITSCEDITDRKKMEEELLNARKLESIGFLAGGIAHDFNNLLAVILGCISLAKMHLSPEDDILEILENAEEASIRAADLTKLLITFSKGGAPVKKTINIAELLRNSAGFALSGSNIKCEFNIPDDLWPVEVDEGQIKQVVYGMVLNSREAMPEGGIINVRAGNITISEKNEFLLKEGEYIKISIEDHGVGIPKENLSRIFDPYFSTKRKATQKGMGLGLSICYSIIKSHNGLITVKSEIGTGTTFHIYLPASSEA
ncbi:MAG: ATP-binding protein, partial [Nitrospirota bacterium]